MFVLAILFMIRTIALTILIIFSPLGFIGLAVPALNKYSSEFWDNLIKYTFFGPVMLFVLAVSVKIISVLNQPTTPLATTGIGGVASAIQAIATPIVILWIGMLVAQKANIWGANAVIGMAEKVAKGVGMKFSGANFIRNRYKAYATERKKRADLKFKDNWGEKLGKSVNKKGYQLDQLRGKVAHEGKIFSWGRTPIGIGATAAKKRADEYFKSDWRESVKKKSDEHENDSIQELTQKDSSPNAMDGLGSLQFNVSGKIEFTGPDADTKRKNYEKNKADLAGRASQFIHRQGDDKKAHMVDSIERGTGEFTEMLRTAPTNIRLIVDAIKRDPTSVSQQNITALMAFINQRMAAIANKNLA